MAALTTARITPFISFCDGYAVPVKCQLADNTTIYSGALVARDSTGKLVNASALSTLTVVGVYDGGDTLVSVTDAVTTDKVRSGIARFDNSTAGDAITVASKGRICYVVDNQTVALTSSSGTRPVAGRIIDVETAGSLGGDVTGVWVLVGALDGSSAGDATVSLKYSLANIGNAAATLAETAIMSHVGSSRTIKRISITPTAGVTANDTDYATITLKKYDGAGGAAVTLATLVTNVAGGSWTALVPKAVTLSATGADLVVTNNNVFTITIAKASSGVVIPASVIVIET